MARELRRVACFAADISRTPATTTSRAWRVSACGACSTFEPEPNFPAGQRHAHHLINRSGYLEIGNRSEGDDCFYSDDDMLWVDTEGGTQPTRTDARTSPDPPRVMKWAKSTTLLVARGR